MWGNSGIVDKSENPGDQTALVQIQLYYLLAVWLTLVKLTSVPQSPHFKQGDRVLNLQKHSKLSRNVCCSWLNLKKTKKISEWPQQVKGQAPHTVNPFGLLSSNINRHTDILQLLFSITLYLPSHTCNCSNHLPNVIYIYILPLH